MKLLVLNSPEIFIITVILLSILGPKIIEKGFLLFKKLLKFLLSKDEDQSSTPPATKPSDASGKKVELEVKAEEAVESEVNEEKIEPEVKSTKPKKRTVNDEIIDVEVDSDN